MTLDYATLERLARRAWQDSTNPRKARTWDAAHKNHWRAKVRSVCALSQSGSTGRTLVGAVWGVK